MSGVGLLNLPDPLYGGMNGPLEALLSPVGALIVWSLLCALAVLFVYRLLSPQAKLRIFKQRMRQIQSELAKDADDLPRILRLSGENIKIALKRFLYTLLPTLIAILPLLSLTSWINSQYGYQVPEAGRVIELNVIPEDAELQVQCLPADEPPAVSRQVVADSDMTGLAVLDLDGTQLAEMHMPPPSSSVSKKVWWNVLLGNPMGYLPENAGIEHIAYNFPRRELIPAGPHWMRGWEFVFLLGMTIFSILLKLKFKVE